LESQCDSHVHCGAESLALPHEAESVCNTSRVGLSFLHGTVTHSSGRERATCRSQLRFPQPRDCYDAESLGLRHCQTGYGDVCLRSLVKHCQSSISHTDQALQFTRRAIPGQVLTNSRVPYHNHPLLPTSCRSTSRLPELKVSILQIPMFARHIPLDRVVGLDRVSTIQYSLRPRQMPHNMNSQDHSSDKYRI
jgi:hypothetical protein